MVDNYHEKRIFARGSTKTLHFVVDSKAQPDGAEYYQNDD
jgi:hypothetical protein